MHDNDKMEKQTKEIIKIILITLTILSFLVLITWGAFIQISQEEAFCKSKGGVNVNMKSQCYFNDNGIYVKYKIVYINGQMELSKWHIPATKHKWRINNDNM